MDDKELELLLELLKKANEEGCLRIYTNKMYKADWIFYDDKKIHISLSEPEIR